MSNQLIQTHLNLPCEVSVAKVTLIKRTNFTIFRLGARSLTLTHNCNNPWADSSLVDKEGNMPVHNGLTPFGKVGQVHLFSEILITDCNSLQ